MLMVIFGAGASYDSSPTYPPDQPFASTDDVYDKSYRPPLAKDLFANRPLFVEALDLFPQCKSIVPRLRDPAVTRGQASIESVLQEIEQQAETYPRGKQELAAVRCYLQRAIAECERHWLATTRGVTNYLSLLREIERNRTGNEPACLVTFNYDTLLESALRDLGDENAINRMEDYTDGSRLFRVFKLHGSINWGQELDSSVPASINTNDPRSVLRYLVEHAADLRISDRFAICSASQMGSVNNRPVFPAIAIPVEKKQVFQCPQSMIEVLTALLPSVNKVMMIGWRATEEHFLALLRAHLRRGVFASIVAGGAAPAEEIKIHINRAMWDKPPDAKAERTGFTDFVRTRRAEQILQAEVR